MTASIDWGHPGFTTVNIAEAFAVDPTGTADAGAQINAALAAMSASGTSGQAAQLPAGTYLITTAVTNPNNVPIVLAPGVVLTGANASTLSTANAPVRQLRPRLGIPKICLIGDSMVTGVAAYGTGTGVRAELWTALSAAMGRPNFVGSQFEAMLTPASGAWTLGEYYCEGWGGRRIDQIDVDCAAGVLAANPDICILVGGTNNFTLTSTQLGSTASALQFMGQLIETVRTNAPNAITIVSSAPPYNVAGSGLAAIQAKIAAYNLALPALCASYGAIYVNAWGSLTTAQLGADNTHPSAAGNTQVAGILATLIESLFPQPAPLLAPRTVAARSSTCVKLTTYNTDYVSIPNLAAAEIGAHSATIELWFYLTSLDPRGLGSMTYTIFCCGAAAPAGNTAVVLRQSDTGTMDMYVGSSDLMSWTNLLSANTWYHVVVKLDAVAGYAHVWLNDQYMGRSSSIAGYNLADAGVSSLGLRPAGLDYGYGMVGYVADFAVSRDDIDGFRLPQTRDIDSAHYEGLPMPGVVYHYPMSEGTGVPGDERGVGSAASFGGGATWGTKTRP